jgi:hypothetical protein
VRVYATRFASGATGLILINEGPDDRAVSIAGVAAGGAGRRDERSAACQECDGLAG